jgi:hypothetical protein
MKDLGNTIYSFGCVVAATVLGIGIADYWFGHHQMTAFLSWAVLAAIPWLIGRASCTFWPVVKNPWPKTYELRWLMSASGQKQT